MSHHVLDLVRMEIDPLGGTPPQPEEAQGRRQQEHAADRNGLLSAQPGCTQASRCFVDSMEAVKDPPLAHEAGGLRLTRGRRLGVGVTVALVASALAILLVEFVLRVQGYRVPVLLS